MSVVTFIPEVWNARLLRRLEAELVWGQATIINTDYEGSIADAGDTVHINFIGQVEVKDYARNVDIAPPDQLDTEALTLLIDQAKYYNFAVDDVDARQAAGQLMGPGMEEASYALSETADLYLASLPGAAVADALDDPDEWPEAAVAGMAADKNQLGTTVAPLELDDAEDAYDFLVDVSVNMDRLRVPRQGRWAVIPSWLDGMLAKDTRILRSLGTDVIPNGFAGRVRGLTLYTSEFLPTDEYDGTYDQVIAGHRLAWSWAQQIVKTEAYRPERRFADAVKGLHVYGAKVVRPNKLVIGTIAKGSGGDE